MALRSVLAAVAIALGAVAQAAYWAMAPSSQVYGTIVTHGPRADKLIALSFDDGPNDPWTLRIADALDQYGVKGTFFVVGQNAAAHPETVRALVERGHVVGNHSYRHRKRDTILGLRYRELDRTEAAIQAAAGVCPALFRAPNGFHTPWQLHAVSRRGLRAIGWDVQPFDWERPPPDTIVRRVLDAAHPGSIILLHDGDDIRQNSERSATLAALPGIIQGLRANGYRLVTVPELLSTSPYLPECRWAGER